MQSGSHISMRDNKCSPAFDFSLRTTRPSPVCGTLFRAQIVPGDTPPPPVRVCVCVFAVLGPVPVTPEKPKVNTRKKHTKVVGFANVIVHNTHTHTLDRRRAHHRPKFPKSTQNTVRPRTSCYMALVGVCGMRAGGQTVTRGKRVSSHAHPYEGAVM